VDGTPCFADFSGTGAGIINPEFARLIAAEERGTASLFAPRTAMNRLWKPPFKSAREEDLLSSLLSMHIGPQDYPGDLTPSPNWPGFAPGKWGPNNALTPLYAWDVNRLYAITPKPRILWLRGSHDQLVADNSYVDMGTLGAMGIVPGWPGAEIYPAQPMLSQTRAVLEKYRAAGGAYNEVVIDDTAHVPFIEKPGEFNKHFHAHIK